VVFCEAMPLWPELGSWRGSTSNGLMILDVTVRTEIRAKQGHLSLTGHCSGSIANKYDQDRTIVSGIEATGNSNLTDIYVATAFVSLRTYQLKA
jgi:hypothetical protein